MLLQGELAGCGDLGIVDLDLVDRAGRRRNARSEGSRKEDAAHDASG